MKHELGNLNDYINKQKEAEDLDQLKSFTSGGEIKDTNSLLKIISFNPNFIDAYIEDMDFNILTLENHLDNPEYKKIKGDYTTFVSRIRNEFKKPPSSYICEDFFGDGHDNEFLRVAMLSPYEFKKRFDFVKDFVEKEFFPSIIALNEYDYHLISFIPMVRLKISKIEKGLKELIAKIESDTNGEKMTKEKISLIRNRMNALNGIKRNINNRKDIFKSN